MAKPEGHSVERKEQGTKGEGQGAKRHSRLALFALLFPPCSSRFALFVCCLLPLAWLWFRLIDHLRVEWAVNPAYSYGWAVPVLCAYLIWQGAKGRAHGGKDEAQSAKRNSPVALPLAPCALLFALFAFLYAPTRLIQEANPDWRLVSWALALIVIGLTLLALPFALRPAPFAPCPARIAFPICFFLVAVPWPTFVEGRLIQWLTAANVGVTIELLGLFGIPAIQHGNIIEISSGVVGVDDACSGIRSFQATLMLSLFFGELYSLTVKRRIMCVFLGFALSFIFNAGRTLLLTVVASFQGVKAIENWHDPAGVTVLVWCFVALWLAALVLKREGKGAKGEGRRAEGEGAKGQQTLGLQTGGNIEHPTSNIEHPTARAGTDSEFRTTGTQHRNGAFPPAGSPPSTLNPQPVRDSTLRAFAFGLMAWFVAVEVGVEWWYRSHEKHAPAAVVWSATFPADKDTFRELPLTEKVRQFLRYDEGRNAAWREDDGIRWQGIFLRWKPGKVAVHLAKSHTPEVCLSAAGRKMVAKSDLRTFEAGGLQLPFFAYVFQGPHDRVHVFYCLWEDRAAGQDFDTESLTYGKRLAPVLAGRRNSGQRTLELAVWGLEDPELAAAAMEQQLKKIVRVQQ